MLDNLRGPNQDQFLERIKAARAPIEDSQEQPEAIETQDAEQEPSEVDLLDNSSDEPELVESDEPKLTENDSEDLYVEFNGREISLKDIHEWEQGYLRQSDYTRKTQAAAEKSKALESEIESVSSMKSELESTIEALNKMISVDESSIDWDELREYDPSEYLKKKEELEAKRKARDEAKSSLGRASQSLGEKEAQAIQSELISMNPHWIKNNQATDEYQKDMSVVNDYLTRNGFTQEDQNAIRSAKQWQAIIDAAKYHAGKAKVETVKAKAKKAPIVTKPKGASMSNAQREVKAAQERHNKEKSVHSAVNLRKVLKKYSK